MRVTVTVVVLLVLGSVCLAVGVYWIGYGVSEALWLHPDLANMPFEAWTPDMKKLHENLVYPYQRLGVDAVMLGIVLVVVPLIARQVALEAVKS